MRFVSFADAKERFRGKDVAIVGSGPSVLSNKPGFVDSHAVVCRVNNYRLSDAAGYRCDVHYSFFGGSIRKGAAELKADGVKLCMCKCPNSQPIKSHWHHTSGKLNGVDFRYIYKNRAHWWFGDVFVPDDAHFLRSFNLLGQHIPTTGFAAILDVLAMQPRSVYLTGFDFFTSGVHNVNEKWKPGNPADPIGHRPDMEAEWLARNIGSYPIMLDETLEQLLRAREAA